MSDTSREQQLQEILVAFLEAVETGNAPDRDEWLAEHPEFAKELKEFLAAREKMEQVAQPLKNVAGEPISDQDAPTIAPTSTQSAGIGSKIRYFGDYELLEEIARGGMGVVYKARQSTLKRIVALKMILSGHLAGEQEVKRFYAEAESAAKLDHPNIVPIFEIGAHDGQHYFSMAFVEGDSLARKVANGPLPPRESAQLMKKITEAVAYAHVEGVIHRDLKPANVLIDQDGEPRVTDFGLAKQVQAEAEDAVGRISNPSHLTQTGQVLGTPSYMPPEQAAAKTGEIGPLSDVYSLGAMLYCLLTGRPPFQASTPLDTLLQVLDNEPVAVRQLNPQAPRDLETICLKCLEKEPKRRYASAHGLAADLERWLAGEPITARRTTPWERTVKWARRRPAVAALLVVGMVIAIGLPLLLGGLLHNAELRAKAVQDLKSADRDLQFAKADTAKQQQLANQAAGKLKAAKRHLITVRKEAHEQRRLAKATLDGALRRADGLRLLGQSSALQIKNPGLSLLLAIEGRKRAPGIMANNALREAIDECREERTIRVGNFFGLALSPDGKLLLSFATAQWYSGEGQARLWDAATGNHVADFVVPPQTVTSATFSPDSKMVAFTFHKYIGLRWSKPPAIVYTDHVVRIYDVASRKQTAILKGHKSWVLSAHFSRDGTKLLTASWDGTARIWNTKTWKAERVIEAHKAALAGARFSPDGRSVLTASSGMSHRRAQDRPRDKKKHELIDPPAGTLPPGVKPGDTPGSISSGASGGSSQEREANAVKIWDVATGQQRVALKHAPKYMHGAIGDGRMFPLAWNSAGDRVLTWSPGSSIGITVWDAKTGEPLVELPCPKKKLISAASLKPDGEHVLTLHQDGSMRVWDTDSGEERAVIRGNVFGGATFSPDGQRVLGLCRDKTARVWSALTGEELFCFRGHQVGLTAAAFSPDGKRVFTASADGTVRIWNIGRAREYAIRLSAGHPLRRVAFSPDGRHVATGPHDRFRFGKRHAQLWDSKTGKVLHTLRGLRSLGKSPVRDQLLGDIVDLQFAPDGRRLLVATRDKRGTYNRPIFGDKGLKVKPSKDDMAFTPIRMWDVQSGKEVHGFHGLRGEAGMAALSPNGKLVLGIEGGRVETLFFLKGSHLPSGNSSDSIRDGQAFIWDAATGKLVQTLKGHLAGITAAAWSPDSQRVVTADYSTGYKVRAVLGKSRADVFTARIWDVRTGKPVVTLEGDRGGVELATFSPDGKHVLMFRRSRSVQIWDAETGKVALVLRGAPHSGHKAAHRPGHTGPISRAAYSPDGSRIVTASWDGTAGIWDATTAKQLHVLKGHFMKVQSAVFSNDGKMVVTASDDQTARVWDAETGEEIITLAGHTRPVMFATFSPDGKQVATASSDSTARIWPIDPLPLALERTPRELTKDERQRFQIK